MINDKSLISIIIPIYNVEKYVSRCIDSVINQTYRELEIILVDDGSTDSSLNICLKYVDKDSRINVFSKENGGLSSARNFGIGQCNGQYVYFLDSDDYIHENTILELYATITQEKSDVVIGKLIYVNDDDILFEQKMSSQHFDREIIKQNKFKYEAIFSPSFLVSAVNKLYNVELFKKFELSFEPNNLIYAEDYLLNSKLLISLNSISINENAIYYYYQNPKSIIHTYKENLPLRYNNLIQSLIKYYQKYNVIDQYQDILFYTVFNAFHNSTLNEYENHRFPFFRIRNICKKLFEYECINENASLYEYNDKSYISKTNLVFFNIFYFLLRLKSSSLMSILFLLKFKFRNRGK